MTPERLAAIKALVETAYNNASVDPVVVYHAAEELLESCTALRVENERLTRQIERLHHPWEVAVSAADIADEARRAALERATEIVRENTDADFPCACGEDIEKAIRAEAEK